ncbi:hypothetical protein P8452_75939 [Trifolium repens]|nr:hypothetical protein P8452_75939 [Trifolium repens]
MGFTPKSNPKPLSPPGTVHSKGFLSCPFVSFCRFVLLGSMFLSFSTGGRKEFPLMSASAQAFALSFHLLSNFLFISKVSAEGMQKG